MKNSFYKAFTACCLMMFAFASANGQTLKSYEQLSKMINQNHKSLVNPTYSVSKGALNSQCYLASAVSSGDAVQQPLYYSVSSAPNDYYVNYSLSGFACERGKTLQLNLFANSTTTKAYSYAFADWDRDGVFEASLGKREITKLSSQGIPSTFYSVDVPVTACLGKTRIRIYLTTTNLPVVNPTDELASGYIYDFVMFTDENSGTATTASVNTSANNSTWGTAVVKTTSPTGDGKFPVGSQVTLEATPTNSMVSFLGWSDGTDIVSTNISYTITVNHSVYLLALFKAASPLLEAPQTSTADAPVWYQIKIAVTDARVDRLIAYSESVPAGYTSQLRLETSENISDKFLWRLEESVDTGKIKIVNRGSGLQIYSNGATKTPLTMQSAGSNFLVSPSGNSNGSYSIMFNGNSTLLINGRYTYDFVLYNGGAGAASGWYFYRVPDELLSTGVKKQFTPGFKVYCAGDKLCIDGLEAGTEVFVYNMVGVPVLKCKIESLSQRVSFALNGMFLALAKNKNQQVSTCKFVR